MSIDFVSYLMTKVANTKMSDGSQIAVSRAREAFAPPPAVARAAQPADVKAILKAELKRRGMTYADLVERLALQGVSETEANLRNKISRGAFTATFFMQCLIAAGCDHVQIGPPRG